MIGKRYGCFWGGGSFFSEKDSGVFHKVRDREATRVLLPKIEDILYNAGKEGI